MATYKKTDRSWDPQTEDIFDYMKQHVVDQEEDDNFGLDDTHILCEVLKVFDLPSRAPTSWIDEALPSRGRGKLICFKGRVLSKTGQVHIHSGIPHPLFMTEDPDHDDGDWWIDLHPVFIGRQKEGKSPVIGEVVSVRFTRSYRTAGGEWFGFFEDFHQAAIGNKGFIKNKIDPKLPFGPDVRRFKPPPEAPEIPWEMPKRILLVGDESFCSSPTATGASTGFASTIQTLINQFYIDITKGANLDGINRLVKRYDIPRGDAKKILSKFSSTQRASAEKLANDTELHVSELMRTAPPEVEFVNASVAYVDGSFFSKEGVSYHEGKAGTVTYKKPWKSGPEGKETFEAENGVDLLESLLKGTNSKGQKFDFAIICGPTGVSAKPGWAGIMDGGFQGDWETIFKANEEQNLGLDLKWMVDVFTQRMAGPEGNPTAFKDEKKKHFKSMLDVIFGGGAVQGAIWLGPPIYVATKYINIKGGLRFKEPRWPRYTTEMTLRRPSDRTTISHPANDPWFDVRYQTSLAIKEVIEEDGGGKVYPCLAYCTKDFGLDPELKPTADLGGLSQRQYVNKLTVHNIPSVQRKNNIINGTRQKAYARWVVRMLVKYLLGTPGGDIPIDATAVLRTHVKDASINDIRISGRFAADQALTAKANGLVRQLEFMSGKDTGDAEEAFKKLAGETIEMYEDYKPD